MSLETASHIGELIDSWPTGSDQRSTADDHFRLLKGAILRTFPNIAGEVSVSHAEINKLDGVTINVQAQFNSLMLEGAAGTASGTVVYALRADNAARLGSVSASLYARLDVPNIFGAGQATVAKNLGTLSGTLNIEPASANYFAAVLGGNVSSISIGDALTVGQVLSIRFQQDATGGAAVAGWPASVLWADGSTFEASTTVSAIDFVTMVRDPLGVWLASPRKYG